MLTDAAKAQYVDIWGCFGGNRCVSRRSTPTRAAEGLTAARERIPDYTPTLAQIAERLKATATAIERIEKTPGITLSPKQWQQRSSRSVPMPAPPTPD
jgi:hypothetical protein